MAKAKPDRWRPPGWFPEDAAAWHAAIIAQLIDSNQLEQAQPIHALLLAQALAQYERCTQAINEGGQVIAYRNDKGEIKREEIAPEAQLQLRLIDKIRQLLKDLTLDHKEEKDETADPFAQLRERMGAIAGGSESSPN